MMKNILWITNVLVGEQREMMGISSKATGGTWLHAAYSAMIGNDDFHLHIATIENVPQMLMRSEGHHSFYILPGTASSQYDVDSTAHIKEWQNLKEIVRPDLVIVWGTETRFAYLAMKIMKDVPQIIYMQGVIRTIAEHYYDGIPSEYRYKTVRDVVDILNKKSQINLFRQQVKYEEEMLKMATAVIVENDWCENVCRGINSKLRVFRNKLPIADVFFESNWSLNKMIPYSIFTNAGGYPIKGHHVLFKALGIVKREYPDFRCFIPGVKLAVFDTFKRKSGFFKLLNDLIKNGNLEDNVFYVGGLSSEQMADYLSKCNVYVMPSIVENHSSSLIEAMVVGAPCVSSLVGGVANIVSHGNNGILYNSLDADSLAGIIMCIFENVDTASFLSDNCKGFRLSRKNDFGKEILEISKSVLL